MIFGDADMYRAFDEDEFFPYFQPLVELRSGQLAGFEVLARWRHGKLGIIPPDEFIPAVEKHGLIDRLTGAILEKAFRVKPLLASSMKLSINLSPIQLVDRALPEKIRASVAPSGFALERLTIEITESALMGDLPSARAVAQDLKSMGCRLSLDDFGTGYSSLKHLQALPLDELKVDKSFVSTMTTARESRKIVAAVVGLGQSLGLETVAEGVETPEHANMLLWLGCDLVQGWLYGRPVPTEEIPRLVSPEWKCYSASISAAAEAEPMMTIDALPAHQLAQLRAIYDGAPVGLCLLDHKMRYVSLNRRLAELNGAPISAHLGKTPGEIIPLTFEVVEPYIRSALRGEPVLGVEVEKPAAESGGSARSLLLNYQPVKDEAGEVVGASVAIVDITQRKRVEQALKESEDHYRSMVRHNPHIPWVLNDKGELIEASPRWEAMTGQTYEETLGDGWQKMLHPDDVRPTLAAIDRCLRTKEPIDVKYRIRTLDGEWRLMRSRGSASVSTHGKVSRIYGTVEDVHDPHQTEEALRVTKAQLIAVLASTPVGVILADAPEGKIVLANAMAEGLFAGRTLLGLQAAEYGKLHAEHEDGSELEAGEYLLARALERSGPLEPEEVWLTRKDGTRIAAELRAAPIVAENGKALGAILFIDAHGLNVQAGNGADFAV